MSVLVLPASVRSAMRSVAECTESVPVHRLVNLSAAFLIGETSESDIKDFSRKTQIPYTTMIESIDALSWILCEAVRSRCSVDQFREFIAEIDFLNTPEVLKVFKNSIETIKECLTRSSQNTNSFVSADWRIEVEYARRSLRSFKHPKVTVNLRTSEGNHLFEASPVALVELHEKLDEALQSCRTSKFRRIQRFVK